MLYTQSLAHKSTRLPLPSNQREKFFSATRIQRSPPFTRIQRSCPFTRTQRSLPCARIQFPEYRGALLLLEEPFIKDWQLPGSRKQRPSRPRIKIQSVPCDVSMNVSTLAFLECSSQLGCSDYCNRLLATTRALLGSSPQRGRISKSQALLPFEEERERGEIIFSVFI